MMGSAQLGVLAACVVLFVPMGLAGYHLSRNKVLFFSGALFITLAVAVHITPYFPSISHLLLSSFSTPPALTSLSCLPFLHQILWSHTRSGAHTWSWPNSGPALSCGFQPLSPSDAGDLLNGSWILVAGDSQARLFTLAFLSLILDPPEFESVQPDLFKRHSDYHLVIPRHAINLDFLWAPFESNLTSHLRKLTLYPRLPEVIIVGDGLWHMLHITDPADYGAELTVIKKSAMILQSSHMFWLGLPKLINSELNTEEKRRKMNETICEAYEQEVRSSKILRRLGGPFVLLDIGILSRGCGSGCTEDGMHYDRVVYEAALHVMLNTLLIESQQRI